MQHTSARPPRTAAAIAGVLLLVAAPATAAPPDAVVEVRSIAYVPSELAVRKGTTVRWPNVTSPDRVHDVVSSIPGLFGSGRYGSGESFSHRFDAAGTYTYICSIHDVMIGAVRLRLFARRVERADGAVLRLRLALTDLPVDSPFRYHVLRADPGSDAFTSWRLTRRGMVTFRPPSAGTYRFVMRLERSDDERATGPAGDSPVLTVVWTG